MAGPTGKEMAFASAMRDFFGFLPGQGIPAFMQELKALTPKDKEDLIKGLETQGYIIRRDSSTPTPTPPSPTP